jgi:hypothetical protein
MALTQPQLVELNSKMNQVFNLDEIETLCFAMGIDFDSLAGAGKNAKIRELIEFCRRRGRDEELVEKVRVERPNVAWPGAPAPQVAPAGGGNQYNNSSHAEGGGTATTTNYIGGSPQVVQPAQPQPQPQPQKKITILFLAANPKDSNPLRLGEEVRNIEEQLRLSQHRETFNLEQQWAVRTTDILAAMRRYKPDIVHFSGHGSADGSLIFEDAAGAAKEVSAEALGQMFRVLKGVRCVVMNACWSNVHAGEIAKSVDCVIGMARSVSDTAAIGFAAGFYGSLGDGMSVGEAFDLGKVQIMLDGGDEQKTPKLKVRSGVDPASVTFA